VVVVVQLEAALITFLQGMIQQVIMSQIIEEVAITIVVMRVQLRRDMQIREQKVICSNLQLID
jgi:hypothetical protein